MLFSVFECSFIPPRCAGCQEGVDVCACARSFILTTRVQQLNYPNEQSSHLMMHLTQMSPNKLKHLQSLEEKSPQEILCFILHHYVRKATLHHICRWSIQVVQHPCGGGGTPIVSLRILKSFFLWRSLRLLRSVCNNSSLCLAPCLFYLAATVWFFQKAGRLSAFPPLLQSSAPRLSWESVARQLREPTGRVQMAVCGEMSHLCCLRRFPRFLWMVLVAALSTWNHS